MNILILTRVLFTNRCHLSACLLVEVVREKGVVCSGGWLTLSYPDEYHFLHTMLKPLSKCGMSTIVISPWWSTCSCRTFSSWHCPAFYVLTVWFNLLLNHIFTSCCQNIHQIFYYYQVFMVKSCYILSAKSQSDDTRCVTLSKKLMLWFLNKFYSFTKYYI